MSILDSLFVGVFGVSVVFIVLVGLSLLVKLQSALINRLSRKKPAEVLIQEAPAEVVQNSAPAVIEETVKPVNVVNSIIRPVARPQREYSGSVGTIKRFNAILNGKVYEAEVEEVQVPPLQASEDMPQYTMTPAAPPAPAGSPPPAKKTVSAPPPAVATVAAGSEVITAPVPGTVLDVKTAVGARVKSGEVLVLLEAMKMENEIVATRDGIVTQVLVSKGASVSSGTPLIAMSDGGM